jgi:LuxR family maltose regulon positive regulatory protein
VACKVTIISAPAGSGKTSLLRTWADRPGRPHRLAVVPLRRDQQDGQQFWLALLGAVRRTNGTAGRAEPPTATPDFNGQAMVDRVLAELADNGDAIIVVIDDLHELHSPEAFDQLTSLLTNLPPHVHAVLTTRHDLRLRLHRLRLAGELAEIRAADLRFTERETRELLDAAGIALSEGAAARLHQRTEGWAAGLRLAALSLAVHPDPERFVAEFSGSERTVAEYLIAEMLERRPVDVQQLLLRTSLLDQVNGELADLLTGRNGSERLLLELEDANAFVVSVDVERTWFRYHHLFADLLRLELRRTWPEEVPALHRRAAGWFLSQGMVAEAIRHTQAAGDWSDAARLLADHAFSLMLDGQAQTLQALLRAFPQGADHPGLALVHASVDVVQGRLDETAAHLAVAETYALTASPDRLPRLRVALALVKLSLARRRGHLAGVLELVEFLDAPLTGQSEEDIALGNDLRAAALMNLGIVEAWSLGVPDGERHLLEGALLARKIGRPYLEVSCLAELGQASKFRSFGSGGCRAGRPRRTGRAGSADRRSLRPRRCARRVPGARTSPHPRQACAATVTDAGPAATDVHVGYVASRYGSGVWSDQWTDVRRCTEHTFTDYAPACVCGWHGRAHAATPTGISPAGAHGPSNTAPDPTPAASDRGTPQAQTPGRLDSLEQSPDRTRPIPRWEERCPRPPRRPVARVSQPGATNVDLPRQRQ